MEIRNTQYNEGTYSIQFEENNDTHLKTTTISFLERWSLTHPLNENPSFYMMKEGTNYPYEPKTNLRSIPIHIPHPLGRYMFKTCFDFFARTTDIPAFAGTAEHPGYPLTLVTYDTSVVSAHVIERLITSIMNGIKTAEVHIEEHQSVTSSEDILDDIDPNAIVEFEFDEVEELSKIIRPISPDRIHSLGGTMTND